MAIGWIPSAMKVKRRFWLFGEKLYVTTFVVGEKIDYDDVIQDYVNAEAYEDAHRLTQERNAFNQLCNELKTK